jgi:hypothetical protein
MSEQRRDGAWTEERDGAWTEESAGMTEPQPLGAGVVHRLRRPGRGSETPHRPGTLAAGFARFAETVTRPPLPHAERVATGPVPGVTLAAAIRTEVTVHRLAPVLGAGAMVVPRDLAPLQSPELTAWPDPVAPRVPDPFSPRPRP